MSRHRNVDQAVLQARVIARLLDDFHGKLTTTKYATLAKVSEDTALRDLGELAPKGVLVRDGIRGKKRRPVGGSRRELGYFAEEPSMKWRSSPTYLSVL